MELAFTVQIGRKSLPLEKLHAEKINFSSVGLCGVNLVNEADVGMTHLERAFQLGRKQALEAGLCRLDGDAQIAFAVDGFINHAHTTFADGAHDLETIINQFPRSKQPV